METLKAALSKIAFRLAAPLLLAGAGLWLWTALRPIEHPPGVLVPGEPLQQALPPAPPSFPAKEGFRLTPLADYRVRARVLSVKRYRDRNGALAPFDMALGWGPMSDTAALSGLKISQGNRFYFYEWKGKPPLPKETIVRHSANVHLIPANREVASFLSRVKTGALVDLQGPLVEARGKDGSVWRSSLTRDDTGNGACELLYVERAWFFDPQASRTAALERQKTTRAARGDLRRWYRALSGWRQALDPADAEEVRAFNAEALQYQAASRPAPSPAPAAALPPKS